MNDRETPENMNIYKTSEHSKIEKCSVWTKELNEWLNNKLDISENRISVLEDKSIENIHAEAEKGRKKQIEKKVRNIVDSVKCYSMYSGLGDRLIIETNQ